MFATIWRFVVSAEHVDEFERAYGPNGEWAQLFARASGYASTELLKQNDADGVYLTIDRWLSEADFHAARRMLHDDYTELDRRFEAYTSEETWLGTHTLLE
ncbi:MAG: antibiotic biosynthesis monooxygenase family protein [Rhodanobacteraceae bacterium]